MTDEQKWSLTFQFSEDKHLKDFLEYMIENVAVDFRYQCTGSKVYLEPIHHKDKDSILTDIDSQGIEYDCDVAYANDKWRTI